MQSDDPLDFWRLASDLSVVDAALLIAGCNPSEYAGLRGLPNPGTPVGSYFSDSGWDKPLGYDATFSSLKSEIRNGHLRAQIKFCSLPSIDRNSSENEFPGGARDHVPSKTGTNPTAGLEIHWGLTVGEYQ